MWTFCFLSFVADVIGTSQFIFTTLLVSNIIEVGPNVYQSLGVALWDYDIISRISHWNVFCEKGALEISGKILQKYPDYQNVLFPEQLFMGWHSWQRVLNTICVMKTSQYSLSHLFKILSNPASPLPPAFTSTAIFDGLFLWLNG